MTRSDSLGFTAHFRAGHGEGDGGACRWRAETAHSQSGACKTTPHRGQHSLSAAGRRMPHGAHGVECSELLTFLRRVKRRYPGSPDGLGIEVRPKLQQVTKSFSEATRVDGAPLSGLASDLAAKLVRPRPRPVMRRRFPVRLEADVRDARCHRFCFCWSFLVRAMASREARHLKEGA
jgi:hypothetical protein